MCWQAARELEAECVRALWQLFVPGRLRANWCKQHSQGLLHESTCCRGVGFLPETLLGLHSNLFHVGKADLCAGSELTKGPAWLPQMSSRSPSFILVCEVLHVFSWLSGKCVREHSPNWATSTFELRPSGCRLAGAVQGWTLILLSCLHRWGRKHLLSNYSNLHCSLLSLHSTAFTVVGDSCRAFQPVFF